MFIIPVSEPNPVPRVVRVTHLNIVNHTHYLLLKYIRFRQCKKWILLIEFAASAAAVAVRVTSFFSTHTKRTKSQLMCLCFPSLFSSRNQISVLF